MNKINNSFFNKSKNIYGKITPLLLSSLFLISCNSPVYVETNPQASGIPSDLQEQIDKTNQSNSTSGNNALIQSKVVYGQLVGRWNSISPLDIEAYMETREKLLPAMFIVANSLSSSTATDADKQSLTTDFRELYFNSLTQMFRGINNNLTVYQSFLENSQIINGTVVEGDPPAFPMTDEAISTLANIFVATETAELFSAQLGQFASVSSSAETQTILNGIKNQQTTVINGIINFVTQNTITDEQAKTAYQIIVKSLTSPTLLSSLSNLAIAVFGKNNVAFNQNEITSAQSNPNLVVMVIKEDSTTYRKINIDSSGKIVNQISNDTRGLSAADLLYQSNVNIIQTTQVPTTTP